tara:strand:- start:725 stop:1132 length:408 start_codon:yes stop_codon:yes gene_type:complete
MNKFLQFNEFVELGEIFKNCEAYLIALEHFNKAIALSYLPINKKRLVEAYDLRGNTNIFLERYIEAISDYTRAIELDPKNKYLFLWRGLAYREKSEYKEAIKDLKTSIHLDPDFKLAKTLVKEIEDLIEYNNSSQ